MMLVYDNEGVRYAEPKLKITGIEAIKSSTPAPCRQAMKDLFKIILNEDENTTQKFIKSFQTQFNSLPAEDIAFPRSVSSVKNYHDNKLIYKKGTPINSRAALLYNHYLHKYDLLDKYQELNDGDRMKYIYLKPRNPIGEDVIGFSDVLPKEFDLHKYIDLDKQFEKTFLDPIVLVLDAIGWKAVEEATLDDFFGV